MVAARTARPASACVAAAARAAAAFAAPASRAVCGARVTATGLPSPAAVASSLSVPRRPLH